MPVFEENSDCILGYVSQEHLRKNHSKSIKGLEQPITHVRLISNATPVTDSIAKIMDSRFLYVLRGTSICGLVTYADFDKRPVRSLLYALISELEKRLIQRMEDEKTSEYWLGKLNHSGRRNVLKWHRQRKAQGMQLSEVDCFSLENIFSAIGREKAFRESVGLEGGDYEETARRIVELRNKVAHPGLDLTATVEELNELIGIKRTLIELLRRAS